MTSLRLLAVYQPAGWLMGTVHMQGLQQAASRLQQLFDDSGMEAGIWNRKPLRTGSATDLEHLNSSPGTHSRRHSEVRPSSPCHWRQQALIATLLLAAMPAWQALVMPASTGQAGCQLTKARAPPKQAWLELMAYRRCSALGA